MQAMLAFSAFLVVVLAKPASADKLDDFKEAVTKSGCESIPYSDLRSSCRSQQDDVHPWCDGNRGPIKCDANGTRDLLSKQDRERRRLEELKDQRRNLEDKRSRATDEADKARWTSELEALDKEIETSKKRGEELRDELDKRKDFVDKAIYTLDKCIDYRQAVMNIFSYATDKVRGEPDADIKPFAETLRNMYPVHISGHQEQIQNRRNALELCKQERP